MIKVSAFIIAKDEENKLPGAVASLRGFVDELIVALDDTTRDGTEKWLRENGIPYRPYRFQDFSQAFNAATAMTTHPWVFQLDADERMRPEHARLLRSFAQRGDDQGIDLFWTARRHWYDLAMTQEHVAFYPDFQARLKRRYVMNRWRVHPTIEGYKRDEKTKDIEIQHLNLFYGGLQKKADHYNALMDLDRADGRNI